MQTIKTNRNKLLEEEMVGCVDGGSIKETRNHRTNDIKMRITLVYILMFVQETLDPSDVLDRGGGQFPLGGTELTS